MRLYLTVCFELSSLCYCQQVAQELEVAAHMGTAAHHAGAAVHGDGPKPLGHVGESGTPGGPLPVLTDASGRVWLCGALPC